MMYEQKFVSVLKTNGKILREHGEEVQVPFGSEYSIPIKNLSNQKALVKITIDGREVTGDGIIVMPNSEIELERFIDNDDLSKGYRFKFIKKTKSVQDHRGDKLEDGLIRIEWWFEKDEPVIWWNTPLLRSQHDNNFFGGQIGAKYEPPGSAVTYSSTGGNAGSMNLCSCNSFGALSRGVEESEPVACASAFPVQSEIEVDNKPLEDEGITVEGSDSDQKFRYASIGRLEPQSHIMIFRLKGYDGNKPVSKPVYVDTRLQCKQCGKNWKSSRKYCGDCGSRLIA